MKTRAFFLFLISGTILALAILAIPSNSVLAKTCYNSKQQVIPCPQPQKRPTATDVPPTLTATSAPQPTDTPAVTNTNTPDAGQLALMCTSMGFIPNTGNPNGNNLNSPPSNPVPDNGSNGFFDVFRNGGGLFGILIGLIVGVLIGLLLPAVQKGFTGGIIAPTDNQGGVIANAVPLLQIAPSDRSSGFDGDLNQNDNPAGIIAPTDSHGFSNVNGDQPPGPPDDTATGPGGGPHTATPPGPPQSAGATDSWYEVTPSQDYPNQSTDAFTNEAQATPGFSNVNGDQPPDPPSNTATGAGGGPHTAQPPGPPG